MVASVAGAAVLAGAADSGRAGKPGRGPPARLRADNLRRIALAMSQYEEANGCFPPAYVTDKHGKPMYSWRVLLLPYLDQEDLADQFRFDEPWDSPANRTVTDLAIGLYQCPSQPGVNGPATNYMMVVGPHNRPDLSG